ncbi:hypothetical protein LEP1GSC059_2816 [Leptospira noguchii serovar Panama str. CZ214]|uniref:Uncharacterized protein n=1 Tax=Leptospira noguchii serovar Panama str. CZ214 TaxID=1001595 RepID=T0FEF8_9LEPT|nr:hypothetical protein LEP1GSC059_2816 [Leptospira noguchii serovar Panama str. CZ214]
MSNPKNAERSFAFRLRLTSGISEERVCCRTEMQAPQRIRTVKRNVFRFFMRTSFFRHWF